MFEPELTCANNTSRERGTNTFRTVVSLIRTSSFTIQTLTRVLSKTRSHNNSSRSSSNRIVKDRTKAMETVFSWVQAAQHLEDELDFNEIQ